MHRQLNRDLLITPCQPDNFVKKRALNGVEKRFRDAGCVQMSEKLSHLTDTHPAEQCVAGLQNNDQYKYNTLHMIQLYTISTFTRGSWLFPSPITVDDDHDSLCELLHKVLTWTAAPLREISILSPSIAAPQPCLLQTLKSCRSMASSTISLFLDPSGSSLISLSWTSEYSLWK